jgi:hypothetical protein
MWFGWQTLAMDGTSLVILASAIPAGARLGGRAHAGVLVCAAVVYLAGGPIVHLAHGRVGVAAASLLTRTLVPGMVIAAAYVAKRTVLDPMRAFLAVHVIATAGGLVAAFAFIPPVVVDAALYARDSFNVF